MKCLQCKIRVKKKNIGKKKKFCSLECCRLYNQIKANKKRSKERKEKRKNREVLFKKCEWCWVVFEIKSTSEKYCRDCIAEVRRVKRKQSVFLRDFYNFKGLLKNKYHAKNKCK